MHMRCFSALRFLKESVKYVRQTAVTIVAILSGRRPSRAYALFLRAQNPKGISEICPPDSCSKSYRIKWHDALAATILVRL